MLSIVVPAYNEGEHIYENLMTIDKALKAFTSDYEIIAVNDGSKDNTGAEVSRAARTSVTRLTAARAEQSHGVPSTAKAT